MRETQVTIVIATLNAGAPLRSCLESLRRQTLTDFQIVVVDNSGKRLVKDSDCEGATIIGNITNVGFGAAINQGIRESSSPYVATINDDAVASPEWLAALVAGIESDAKIGLCASRVTLDDTGRLDSAGMLIAGDGSSKQRGHGAPPAVFSRTEEVLLPSGSAALYRRAMLDETGGFDDAFFLYCEDTDLGLRARWAGWRCLYVPEAEVRHAYSATAGRGSRLKAYYVERNRGFVALKNFPAGMLWKAPLVAMIRYWWHAVALLQRKGTGAEYRRDGNSALWLPLFVIAGHLALAAHAWRLLRQRREIRRSARLSAEEFRALLKRHWISPREVALL